MVVKIISGGQTSGDRAALDFAIEHGIPAGGWCPKGRLAEDGRIEKSPFNRTHNHWPLAPRVNRPLPRGRQCGSGCTTSFAIA